MPYSIPQTPIFVKIHRGRFAAGCEAVGVLKRRFCRCSAEHVPDYFYLLTQRRRGAECSTQTVGKRPPLPLRLRLRTLQPLTRDFRRRFVDRIYKIDRIEKRELGHWPMHAADLPRRQCVTGTVSQGSAPVDTLILNCRRFCDSSKHISLSSCRRFCDN